MYLFKSSSLFSNPRFPYILHVNSAMLPRPLSVNMCLNVYMREIPRYYNSIYVIYYFRYTYNLIDLIKYALFIFIIFFIFKYQFMSTFIII